MTSTTTNTTQTKVGNPPTEKKKGSLRLKFGLSIILLLTATIFFITFFALKGEEVALRKEMEQRGVTIAKNMATNAAKPLLRGEILPLASLVKDAMGNSGVLYAVLVDENGMIVAHNDITRAGNPYKPPTPAIRPLQNNKLKISNIFIYKNTKTVDIAVPVLLKNQAKLGEVHIGLSQAAIDEVIRNAVTQIIILAIIFIVVGVLVTLVLVSVIVRPIKALEQGAEIIGQGNLDFNIAVKSNDEIGNLASSFNQMTNDLKHAQKNLIEKEKMEQELETARKIQAVLLPKANPDVPGFEIVSYYNSAKEVGGDYYDFHEISDTLLGLTVADVSGKGIPGALGMVMTRSILRSQVYLADAAKTISKTNALLYKDIKRGMFVTMFHAILNLNKNTLNCANAGHNPLMIAHANGKVDTISLDGMALGLDRGARFDKKMGTQTITLKSGDVFIMYTDGITEAMNKQEEEFEEERLAEILGSSVKLSAKEITENIIAGLNKFTDGAPQFDDITMLTIKVK